MKRKYLGNIEWKGIKEQTRVAAGYRAELGGYFALIRIVSVFEPFIAAHSKMNVTLIDDGFLWLQILPLGQNYAVTTAFNARGEILQWYIDVTAQNGVDVNDRPFYDDLYLDVVVLPDGEKILLDEDDLTDALCAGKIKETDYRLAHSVADRLLRRNEFSAASLSKQSLSVLNRIMEPSIKQ